MARQDGARAGGSGAREVSVCMSVCPCASPHRHGQLGHGTLESEPQPRLLEALAGVAMRAVAAGGWHSASVSGEGPRQPQGGRWLVTAYGPGRASPTRLLSHIPGAPLPRGHPEVLLPPQRLEISTCGAGTSPGSWPCPPKRWRKSGRRMRTQVQVGTLLVGRWVVLAAQCGAGGSESVGELSILSSQGTPR